MKKIIRKFWGVALVVMLLSSLLVIPATPAAAWEYALSDSFSIPGGILDTTTKMAPAGLGILDVAQSGTTMYAVGDAAGVEYLYKSEDGGATWVIAATIAAPTANAHGLPTGAGATWGLVGVAPDDPDIVVVVNTQPALADVAYLSLNGGVLFQALTATAADLNDVDISHAAPFRYIAIGGNTVAPALGSGGGYLASWTIGALVGAWTPVAGLPACDDVEVAAYSEGFISDQILMSVTEIVGGVAVAGNVALHIYSYNTALWDAAIDVSFPRVLASSAAGTVLTCARADITQDVNFTLADEALQIGFIGADITTPAATQAGGVYRIGTYTIVGATYMMTQIMAGTAINSVAWDGANLMAAQRGAFANGLPIWRCANALTVFATFSKNSALKSPGTGNSALVIYNGETGYCFSQGNNSAVARTTDQGKSFNGIALVNSNFGTILDYWTSPDGATQYVTVDDGVDLNVWRCQAFAWERVAIYATHTGEVWLVRGDADTPENVYIGWQANKNMFRSTDAGDFTWTARSCSQNIGDFVVQDNQTVYVAVNAAALVVRTTTGAFTWTNPPTVVPFATGGGNCYSITLVSDDHVLIGGTAGGVAYTTDGETWNGMVNLTFGGNTVLVATGLDTGDSVFAVTSGAFGGINRWTFGTNIVAWTAGQAMAGAVNVGIAYGNGVLYVLDDANGNFYRVLHPFVAANAFALATTTEAFAELGAYTQGVNKLSVTMAGPTTNMVWAVNAAAADTLDQFIDYMPTAGSAPTLIYPLDGDQIAVNSISGAVAGFVFKWNAPPVVSFFGVTQNYDYNLEVYLDEAATIPVAGSPVAAVFGAVTPAPTLSIGAGLVAGWAPVPGETYYWRVRVDMGAPAESYWSEMSSFSIQQLAALVPVISSPANGATIDSLTPAFSWGPIADVTTYRFELAKEPEFALIVYTADVTTSSAALPVATQLERGKTYFWRVKALLPAEGEWSQVGIFTVAEEEPTPSPTPTITPTFTVPMPTIYATVTAPQPTVTVVLPTTTEAPVEEIATAYIWAIIIIGAVLVIAVIVLIVRTRRTV